jgi:hypothetical protein
MATTAMAGGRGIKSTPSGKAVIPEGVTVNLSGHILDNHKEPISEAEVVILVNGAEMDRIVTASSGDYISRFQLDNKSVDTSTIQIKVRKPSFGARLLKLKGTDLARKGSHYFFSQDVVMPRILGPAFWISTVLFILAYCLIAFELLHRTIAAMLGAALMLLISHTIGTLWPAFHIFSFERAVEAIDMNVIFLLMGMMVIVGVLKHTGVFQWCAYISYRLARGKVFLLVIYLMIFTAVSSAFLDNVTTMLLLTGVAIEIAVSLTINPITLLIPLVLASNVGGTSTLIGDPPNIMIGSYAGLTFMDFVIALALVCVVTMIVLFVFTKLVWGKGTQMQRWKMWKNTSDYIVSNFGFRASDLEPRYGQK